ncbi:MAG: dUTP diphosphatase [Clostridia bacterium]|nr:dUTP diphosphatase [Clostridia bacterium]
MKEIIFKKLDEKAILPKYAKPGDAGMDISSIEDIVIPARGIALVHTGLCMQLPERTEAQVRSRSGLALKHGIFVLNSPGTIDEGYTGEICVILGNLKDEDFKVNSGDRIAQMVIAELCPVTISETKGELKQTERGSGGFGSSGIKSN